MIPVLSIQSVISPIGCRCSGLPILLTQLPPISGQVTDVGIFTGRISKPSVANQRSSYISREFASAVSQCSALLKTSLSELKRRCWCANVVVLTYCAFPRCLAGWLSSSMAREDQNQQPSCGAQEGGGWMDRSPPRTSWARDHR